MDTPPPVGFAKDLVTQITEDDVPDLAAGLAYRFLFALFPFAIFLAALSSFMAPMIGIEDPTGKILSSVSDTLPPDVSAQIKPQLQAVLGQARPGLLSLGALMALWAARGGISAVIKAMNKAYDVDETRGFVSQTALSVALTLVGSAGIVLAFVAIVGGSVVSQQAASAVGIDNATWRTISLLRYPLVLALVAVAMAVLFHFGPNVQVSFRWSLFGGVVFALFWLIGTVVFGLYVANFGNYSNTYGALGGVVILMLWFYLTALLMLIAAEITSLLALGAEPERVEERRRQVRGDDGTQGSDTGASAPTSSEQDPDPSAGGGPSPVDRPGARRSPLRRPSLRLAPTRLAAVGVMAVAAVAGAVLGHLAGSDDQPANWT